MQDNRPAGLAELPSGFGSGKTAADDMHSLQLPLFHSTITRPANEQPQCARPEPPESFAGGLEKRNARDVSRALSRPISRRWGLGALGGAPRNTRDIRAADANIGKLTVAQARQFVQTAVIALPLLDEANECGKHSILLSVSSGSGRSFITN